MLAIRLPEDIEKRLDRLAKRTGRTKTYYAREAILKHLEDLEDIYIAEKRLEDLYAGRSHAVPLEDVMRKRGNLED
jgi:RHH-type rel operon transcriptional repressor/antitoxin RelB